MSTVGLLHTAPVHVATFNELVGELAPGWTAEHLVDESLLERARLDGLATVSDAVGRALLDLAARNVELIVCTCSTIGGLAEASAGTVDVRVVRVDRPMAELAVATGGRVAIVAALESTIGPTTELVSGISAGRGVHIEIATHVVAEAWERFEAGDLDGYARVIAAVLPSLAASADVVVLAQASMAGAVGIAGEVGIPVLASPRTAIEQLLR